MRRLAALAVTITLAGSGCIWAGEDTPTTATDPAPVTEAPTTTADPADRAAVREVAASLLDGWAAGEIAAVRSAMTDAPSDLAEIHGSWVDDLSVLEASFDVLGVRISGDRAEADYQADLELGGAGPWLYEGTLDLELTGGKWRVPWSPAIVHPSLEPGDRLEVIRTWPARAPILGTRGTTLVTDRAVKTIGVVPERITDLEALLAGLEEFAGIPPETVTRELERPGVQPDWYLPVGWMPLVDYLGVQAQLEALEGAEMRDDTERLPPAEPFAEHVLGTTGPVTAELLETLGEPYRAGDIVGLSGLELAMEATLAGYPTFEVQRVNQFGRVLDVLHTAPGAASNPVRTTLSADVQLAVEAAIENAESQAAVVVTDAATGEIRAVASRPLDGFNRALSGLYPPGSTFKVVTAAALLGAGTGPDDPVACPATVTVGGREFRNAGERGLGEIPLREAFAESCNTTFAALAAELGAGPLTTEAERFGFNSDPDLALAAAGPLFPVPPEAADVAAAAIGQGAVQTTPLYQATAAAAGADGAWRAPRLLETDPASAPIALDPAVAEDLASMMRLVVTDGTGTEAEVPGEEVYGKTGSAEWAETEPTHAWFIGFWEGYGFAVVVEAAGAGGTEAAPIARALIEELSGPIE